MESVYEQPRTAPVPATFKEVAPDNIISDISIFLPSDSTTSYCKLPLNGNKLSYKAWKSTDHCLRQSAQTCSNKRVPSLYSEFTSDKICRVSSQKHVRFNSPHSQNTILTTSVKEDEHYIGKSVDKINSKEGAQKLNTGFNKSLQEMYMANVPNRHLDVSIIKPSTIANDSNLYISDQIISETVREHQNDGRISALRKLKVQTIPDTSFRDPKKYKGCNGSQSKGSSYCLDTDNCRSPVEVDYNEHKFVQRQTSDCTKSDAVTTELLKIIQQQNEQILLLQKQIQFLMQNQTSHNETKIHNKGEQSLTAWKSTATTQTKDTQLRELQSASTVSKLAIDVTTSFEVSFQSQAANFLQNKFARKDVTLTGTRETGKQNTFTTKPKKNCNLLEDIKNRGIKDVRENQNADMSLTLNEPVQVVAQCPSPDNSVHVDMNDYSSDSEVESASSNDLGWTIYNNVMGQVNNMLRKVEDEDLQNSTDMSPLDEKTLHKIREATMRHLREIDMNLPVINEPISSRRQSETTENCEYSPTEVSFAIKQLLMKYLPNDQLAKLAQTNVPTSSESGNDRDTDNLIKKRSDFSFATMQYMKKYNLLSSDSTPIQPTHSNKNAKSTKFLDITTLRRQPKLL